ncbi:MAG: hypothetical protein ABH879_08995 [archaeon]
MGNYRLLVAIILLLSSFAYALEPIELEVTSIKKTILANESAEFNLTISSNQKRIDTVSIGSPDLVNWDVYTDPLSDYFVKVYPFSSRSVVVKAKPLYILPGQYVLRLTVKSSLTGAVANSQQIIILKGAATGPKEYLPSMSVVLDMDDQVDSRDALPLTVRVKNLVPLALDHVSIKLQSDVAEGESVIDMDPREEVVQDFSLTLDPFETPGRHSIMAVVTLDAGNRTYVWKSEPKSFDIISYSEQIRSAEPSRGFLKTEILVRVLNDGNVEKTGQLMEAVPFMRFLYASAEPEARIEKMEGKKYYVWDYSLAPQGVFNATIHKNYRPVVSVIAALIIIITAYFWLRSPVIASKTVVGITKHEGGISSLKLKLHIKNRSSGAIPEVSITDKVPGIAELVQDFGLGTLKPNKVVKHASKSVSIKWHLESLDAHEERLITYKIRSKLSILGGFSLPAAVVKYQNKKGKIVAYRSNKLVLQMK